MSNKFPLFFQKSFISIISNPVSFRFFKVPPFFFLQQKSQPSPAAQEILIGWIFDQTKGTVSNVPRAAAFIFTWQSSGMSKYIPNLYPIGSMSGIFTYIWLKFMVHAGEYTIHGSYGYQVEIYIAYLAITDHWIKALN